MYERILRLTAGKSVHAVVDTTGESLEKALPYRPFLVKPNHHELGELFGVTLESLEQTEDCARRVQAQGRGTCFVSMADKGALLLDEEGRLHRGFPAWRGRQRGGGRGDSMVAGFLAGYARTGGLRVGAGTGDRGGERYRLLSLAGRQTGHPRPARPAGSLWFIENGCFHKTSRIAELSG